MPHKICVIFVCRGLILFVFNIINYHLSLPSPQMIKPRNPHTEKPSREKYNFFTINHSINTKLWNNFFTMKTCSNIRVYLTLVKKVKITMYTITSPYCNKLYLNHPHIFKSVITVSSFFFVNFKLKFNSFVINLSFVHSCLDQ